MLVMTRRGGRLQSAQPRGRSAVPPEHADVGQLILHCGGEVGSGGEVVALPNVREDTCKDASGLPEAGSGYVALRSLAVA